MSTALVANSPKHYSHSKTCIQQLLFKTIKHLLLLVFCCSIFEFLFGIIKCSFSFIVDRLRHLSLRKSNMYRYLFVGKSKSIAFACDRLQSVDILSQNVHLVHSFAWKQTFSKLTTTNKIWQIFRSGNWNAALFCTSKDFHNGTTLVAANLCLFCLFVLVEVLTHINEISFPIEQLCATRFHFVEFTVSFSFGVRFAYDSSFLFTWLHIRHVNFFFV